MHVLVSGGTGFIGQHVVSRLLENKHEVTVISRNPSKVREGVNAYKLTDLPGSFDAVINLAGATLDRRWSGSYKQEIVDSRVQFTNTLREVAEKVGAKHFVSGSAIGYYGDRADEIVDETSAPGDDFLADLSVKWEAAAQSDKLRVVLVRTGLVLHHSGGALKAMLPFFKWMLGGRLGNGQQYWSWIHLDDIVGIFIWALENEDVADVVNGTAPTPVTNREFTRTLAKAVHRPVSLPVPKLALKILYGEMADMILKGQRVKPARTLQLGYDFQYENLGPALEAALS